MSGMPSSAAPVRARRRWFAAGAIIAAGMAALLLLGFGLWVARQRRAAELPAGTSVHTVTVDGRERSYRLYRPAPARSDRRVPLVMVLHGALGTGEQAQGAYHWDGAAERDGFAVAYPDGYRRTWAINDGCCGPAAREAVDDVAFLTRMVEAIARAVPVDRRRVYAAGMSNGGMMAYKLACETDLLAALGGVATTMLAPCATPAKLSVLHIHGMSDASIPYAGGPGKRDNGGDGRSPVRLDGPPIPDLLARWRVVDGCAPPTVTAEGPVTWTRAACPDGRAVQLAAIADAGHQWPGATRDPRAEQALDLDPPSTAMDATSVLWQFFAAHGKP